MKKQLNTLFSSLSLEEKLNLTKAVEETLAEVFLPSLKKNFTEAEL